MEIGMDKRQSDIFMRKFDELIKKKAKVAPCFFFVLQQFSSFLNLKITIIKVVINYKSI